MRHRFICKWTAHTCCAIHHLPFYDIYKKISNKNIFIAGAILMSQLVFLFFYFFSFAKCNTEECAAVCTKTIALHQCKYHCSDGWRLRCNNAIKRLLMVHSCFCSAASAQFSLTFFQRHDVRAHLSLNVCVCVWVNVSGGMSVPFRKCLFIHAENSKRNIFFVGHGWYHIRHDSVQF